MRKVHFLWGCETMEISDLIKPVIGAAILVGGGYWLYDGGWEGLTSKPGRVGVTIYTATQNANLEEELFLSTGMKPETEADAEAFTLCNASIEGVPGLTCAKITFMPRHTCMVRYRIGSGIYAAEKPSLESADVAAKFNCESSQSNEDPNFECIKDAEICTEGSVRKLRIWGRAAFGVTKPFTSTDDRGAFMNMGIFGGPQPSEAAGLEAMEKACLEQTGETCLTQKTFSGDICYAFSASTSGHFAYMRGQNEFAVKLKTLANCGMQTDSECSANWICASPLTWN